MGLRLGLEIGLADPMAVNTDRSMHFLEYICTVA